MSRVSTIVVTLMLALHVIAPGASAQQVVTVTNGSVLPAGTIGVTEVVNHSNRTIDIFGGVLGAEFRVGTFGSVQNNAWTGYTSFGHAQGDACRNALARANDGQFGAYRVLWNGLPPTSDCNRVGGAPQLPVYPPPGGYIPPAPVYQPPIQFAAPAPPIQVQIQPSLPASSYAPAVPSGLQPVAINPPPSRAGPPRNEYNVARCNGPSVQRVQPDSWLAPNTWAIIRTIDWNTRTADVTFGQLQGWMFIGSAYDDDPMHISAAWRQCSNQPWDWWDTDTCGEATEIWRGGLGSYGWYITRNHAPAPWDDCADPE